MIKKYTSLTLAGDVMMGRRVGEKIKEKGYRYPFLGVVDILKDSDVTFVNLEAPISKRGKALKSKRITFKTPPQAAKSLEYAGIDIVSLANNHVLDYGRDALEDTLKFLNRTNIKNIGLYYHHKSWNNKPIKRFEIIRKNNIRLGFLAYSAIVPGNFLSTEDRPGIMSAIFFEKAITKDVKELKKKVDVVVVSLHMGREYFKNVTEYQKAYARKAIDVGADIVVGHHPHVLERIENYKNGLIFYSLGNLVFDQKEQKHKGVSKSMIVKVFFEGSKISYIKIIPVVIKNYQPRLFAWDIDYYFTKR